MVQFLKAVAVAALASGVVAHPGADVRAEARARAVHLNDPERRTMSECHAELEKSGYYKRELERRAATAHKLRQARGLPSGKEFKA
jgi:hypothetical protein